jgi:hypothetical protein
LRYRVVITGIVVSAGLGLPTLAAAASHSHRPVIASIRVSRAGVLPSAGTPVTVTVRVRRAKRCSFLRQPAPGSKLRVFRTRPCAHGRAKVTFPAVRNQSHSGVRLTYAVRAIRPGQPVAQRKFSRREAAAPTPAPTPPTVVQSSNWSGYVVPSGSLVTDAAGTFTVPTLDCAQTANASEATWVGIGGGGSGTGDLLQTGVESDCVGGIQADDPAWWEEFPEVASIDFSGMTLSAGDQVVASVFRSTSGATTWETCLDDLTTGTAGVMITGEGWGVTTGGCSGPFTAQGSTATLSYAGGTTAEWIVEDFSLGNSLVPFADYGTLTFSNLRTSIPSWSLAAAEEVELVQNGSIVSQPSAPSGTGFSVSYQAP